MPDVQLFSFVQDAVSFANNKTVIKAAKTRSRNYAMIEERSLLKKKTIKKVSYFTDHELPCG